MSEIRPLKLVFLGTPDIVVTVAEILRSAPSVCEIGLVVTQPPARRGRGQAAKEMPTPIALWAQGEGLSVLTPAKAGDPEFLESLRKFEPDVCVTAAYGQYLPKAFLDIPKLGTLNIHPSLLPQFRGAAPVQRTLEAGLTRTGVTVLFSTAKMDAGPIVAQLESPIEPSEDAHSLLGRLFREGALQLLDVLKTYQSRGREALILTDQDESAATEAPKIRAEEGTLDPADWSAQDIVNKIRAFSLWPGVKFNFELPGGPTPVKILRAGVVPQTGSPRGLGEAWFTDTGLHIQCKSSESVIEVVELQLPGKRPVAAREARNGWPGGQPQLARSETKG